MNGYWHQTLAKRSGIPLVLACLLLLFGAGSCFPQSSLLRENLWPNPHFELGNPDETKPEFWERVGTTPEGGVWTTAWSVSPTHSLRVQDQNSTGYSEWQSGAVSVQTGKNYRLKFFRRYSCDGDMRLSVNFNNETGVVSSVHFVVAGHQAQWEEVDAQLQVPPQASRLRLVLASGGALEVRGHLDIDDLSLALIPDPAIWESAWFLAGVGLALVLTVAGTVRYVGHRRFSQRIGKLKKEHDVEMERNRIARDIHDQLGSTMTQISLLSELARANLSDPQLAGADLDRISEMARELTRSLDEIVWAVDPQNDTLESFISYAGTFAQKYLNLAGLRCRLDVPTALPSRKVSSEVRHHVFLAMKEALTNVVKHAGAKEVRLTVTLKGAEVGLLISDDGCGGASLPQTVLRDSSSRTGNGLLNLHRRMEEIGGKCWVRSEPGRGTQVELRARV